MEEDIDYEAPIANFRRLIKQDHSEEFKIFITCSSNNGPENEICIKTTVNEARIISQKIDKAYQIDPTICQYSIRIPKYFINDNIGQSDLQEIIEFLINSTNQKVHIQKEKRKLFTIF